MEYNYKNIITHPELPFDYSYDEKNTPFVKEYSKMFSLLNLEHIPRFSYGVGQNGYDNHAMIKALIVYALEGYRSILQLIRELESKPYFSRHVIGFKKTIPNNSKFYRFLKNFDPKIVHELLTQINKKNFIKKLPKMIAIDSKPVKANTKENNPKTFNKNLNKNNIPKRNPDATLSYFAKQNDKTDKILYFWGYRLHIIVDVENDNPLVYILIKNNIKDDDAAIILYRELLNYYPSLYQTGLSQLADKGYYSKKVFDEFYFLYAGKSFIPVNKRNSKNLNPKIPICKNNLKMKYNGSWFDEKQNRFRIKFSCPIKNKKCKFKKSKYGCSKYFQIRKPFPGEVMQHSQTFQNTYPKRQSVERVNAFLQNLGWENPKLYSMKSIENLIGFALIGKVLKSLALSK